MPHDQKSVDNCPFCFENGLLKGEILAETDGAYLIGAYQRPGNYLVIPKQHARNTF